MSEPPPPSGPPAGWYPDPQTGAGYRWWDGSTWTDAVSANQVAIDSNESPDLIGSVDRLLSETLRLSSARAGHLLPLIVLFVLSIGLASSVALWFGLRDTTVTFDEAASNPPEVVYGGSATALWIYLALVPLSLLGGALVQAATARQIWATQADRVEAWSASLRVVLGRWRPLLVGLAAKWLIYLVLGIGFLVATALVPAFIIAFPFVLIALVLAWLRLSFVGQAAVLGPSGVRPLSTSYRVSGQQGAKLFLRLIVLVLVGAALMLVISLFGSIFTAIAGADGTTPIDPDALTYDLNAALGDNVALFALSAVFGSLALGGATVIVATGTTLLYRNLEGPIDPDAVVTGDRADRSTVANADDRANDEPMIG